MIYIFDFFRHSWDVDTTFPNIWKFLVCLSVCELGKFLTEIRPKKGYLLSWMRYLPEIFGDISRIFLDYLQIISNFLYVCQSNSWLTSLLKLGKDRDISISGWYIFLKIFGDIPWMLLHHFQILLNFLYVCQFVSWLTSLLNLDK